MLAIKIIANQGIDVIALNFDVGFGGDREKIALMTKRANKAGAEFEEINIRSKYLQKVLFSPKYGYGKHFNPCIDCHGFMFKTAVSMMKDYGASFIISGEVLGQRPMSQRNIAMNQVKSLSGDNDNIILRPLCAKLLEPSKPELLGWVDREKLLDISGRSRTRQIELASEFGFDDYETPGGGCPYTTESFSARIRDFIAFDEQMREEDLQILRYGRHFRLPNNAKLVVGRDESENEKLAMINNDKFERIHIDNLVGALVLISKNASQSDKILGAQIAATYAKSEIDTLYDAKIGDEIYEIYPLKSKDEAKKYFVI